MNVSTTLSTSPAAGQRQLVPLIPIEDIPLFGGLTGTPLALVLCHLERRALRAGSWVFRSGEQARELYIVEAGEVEIGHSARGRLRAVSAGGSFGELALLDLQPRSTSARTRQPTSLLVLPYRTLLPLQATYPEAFTLLIMNIAREAARRLRVAYQRRQKGLGCAALPQPTSLGL